MQYKPLWLINVRQKYAKCRFEYVEIIATKFSIAAVDLQKISVAALGFSYWFLSIPLLGTVW
jgi:hypothetical protein